MQSKLHTKFIHTREEFSNIFHSHKTYQHMARWTPFSSTFKHHTTSNLSTKKNSKSQGASMHHWRDNMQGLWAFFPFSFSTLNLSQTLQPQKPSHTRHCSNDHQELRRSDSIRIRRKPLLEVRPNQLIYEFLRFTLSINLVYLGFFSTNFSSSPDIGSSLNQH